MPAPIDTVFIRDLATGGERRHEVPRPAAAALTFELWTDAWGPTTDVVYLEDTEGSVRNFSARFDGAAAGDEVACIPDVSWNRSLVGFRPFQMDLLVEVESWQLVWSQRTLATALFLRDSPNG